MTMKLLIADDHELVCDALSALIHQQQPDAEILTAEDIDSALSALTTADGVDVILLDLNMPGMEHMDGIRRCREAHPDTPIMLMSGLANKLEIDAAFDMGVMGYIPKTMAGKSLVSALHILVAGERYIHASLLRNNDPYAQESNSTKTQLTNKEQEVLNQLFMGNANKEIARQLDISENTVKFHLRALCNKLKARNRTDIVIQAIKLGLRNV